MDATTSPPPYIIQITHAHMETYPPPPTIIKNFANDRICTRTQTRMRVFAEVLVCCSICENTGRMHALSSPCRRKKLKTENKIGGVGRKILDNGNKIVWPPMPSCDFQNVKISKGRRWCRQVRKKIWLKNFFVGWGTLCKFVQV